MVGAVEGGGGGRGEGEKEEEEGEKREEGVEHVFVCLFVWDGAGWGGGGEERGRGGEERRERGDCLCFFLCLEWQTMKVLGGIV